ncbi:MAG: hypothetical protein KGK07_13695 [Chloroflexota bacterium]|nr:hypothetical protein [Chloroflexota bacterium]
MAGPKYPLTIRYRGETRDARNLKKVAAFYKRSESDVLRLLVAEAAARVDAIEAKKKGHGVATE